MRPATAEERERHGEIRRKVMQEIPPVEDAGRKPAPAGIEYGRDAQLSNVQAVAKVLGLRLELAEELF